LPSNVKTQIDLTENAEIKNGGNFVQLSDNNVERLLGDFDKEKADLLAKLAAAVKVVDEYQRLKTTFIANVSHEMRTPLNAILGFSELAQFSDVTLEEMREYMRIVHKSSEQLLDTVKDVIFIATLDADEITVVDNPISVRSLFQDLEEYYSFFGEEKFTKNIQLIFKWPQDDLLFTSDFDKLTQVFKKLLDNAFKFTHKGLVEVGYVLLLDRTIQFYVKDAGIGIPAEKLDMIFEPFRCVEESHSRQYGGSGLGLAIVKRLVKLLGGQVQVESEPGKGTTMRFTVGYRPSSNKIIL